jgi:hypothetical protein
MKKYLLFILILWNVQLFGQGIFWTYPTEKLTSNIFFDYSGSGTSVQYITGRYNLTISTDNGYTSIDVVIYTAAMGYVNSESISSETGRLTTQLKPGYIVYFYVREVPPVVYSDPIDQWFYHICGGGSCAVNYTYMGLYHMVDAGTFTGATKEEANAARDAYGQAQADAATCECVYTGPPP